VLALPEPKPVTQSRDTQELPYNAGVEVLQILSSYQSTTTLLQDMNYYEQQHQSQAQSSNSPNPQSQNNNKRQTNQLPSNFSNGLSNQLNSSIPATATQSATQSQSQRAW